MKPTGQQGNSQVGLSRAKLTASANMATDAELEYSPEGQRTRAKLQLHALREAIEQAQPIKSTKMH